MKYLIFSSLLLIFISCGSSRVYDDFDDMDQAFWHMDSVQNFTFEINDTNRSYNLLATFRNSASYPFYNLYFQYSLKDSTNSLLEQRLQEVLFFDSKTGEPLGSGLGDLFDHAVSLEESYQFSTPGKYTIELQQFMRMDTLPFILSVGARVEFEELN